jgi:anti-anti-sigma factor
MLSNESESGSSGRPHQMSATDSEIQVDVRDLGTSAVLIPRIAYLNYSSSDTVKPHLKQACAARVAAGAKAIVLDLTDVGLVDSCGLSLLISLKKAVDAENVRFALCGLTPVIQRLFEITKLDRAFQIFPDQSSAVRGDV